MKRFDVCIIGAGPAGYAAAMRALDYKKRVLLIERDRIGGAGLHNGALSSKAWWELAREYHMLRNNAHAFRFDLPVLSLKRLKREVGRAIFERQDLLEYHMKSFQHDNGDLLTFVQGEALLRSPHNIEVKEGNKKSKYEADYIVLATGSRPRKLPHIAVDEKIIMTSDGVHQLERWPASMVILGAGVIGCEFATIFSNFRQTRVSIIDKGDRILPFEDEDVARVIEERMASKGVNVHRNSRLTRMSIVDGEVEYELEYKNGRRELFYAEKALIAVGRVPNYEILNLKEIGVKIDERGIIDENTQTSIENIYAVGDITADIALVNIGELEGRYAIECIFGKSKRKLIYENISTIMFLDPEVAGVGINEIKAQEMKLNYKVASIDYNCISRAIAMRNTKGFIKILVTDEAEMKILGIRVVGEHASSAIQAVALLISMDKSIEEIAELVHPHPSIIEGIQECVRMLLGTSMFKPSVIKEAMTCKRYIDGEYEDVF